MVPSKLQLTGWSTTVFKNDYRCLANVELCYALILDYDHHSSFDHIDLTWGEYTRILYTTHSHSPKDQRIRLVLPLTEPCSADDYYSTWEWANAQDGMIDKSCKDPSRLWFSPGIAVAGAPFVCAFVAGVPVAPVRAAQKPAVKSDRVAEQRAALIESSTIDRARAYLKKVDPAVAGQRGHNKTFLTAQRLVRGFGIDKATALSLMLEWNETCQPPWSEKELARKIDEASRSGTMTPGSLL